MAPLTPQRRRAYCCDREKIGTVGYEPRILLALQQRGETAVPVRGYRPPQHIDASAARATQPVPDRRASIVGADLPHDVVEALQEGGGGGGMLIELEVRGNEQREGVAGMFSSQEDLTGLVEHQAYEEGEEVVGAWDVGYGIRRDRRCQRRSVAYQHGSALSGLLSVFVEIDLRSVGCFD